MTRRKLVAMGYALTLMLAVPMLAQTQKPGTADPISGSWTGELVLVGRGPIPVTMELKFDGKSAITGTVEGMPNPADVKVGTFDRKKGALKLELGKKGEPATLLTLEGAVAKDVATGRFTGDESGAFKLTRKQP